MMNSNTKHYYKATIQYDGTNYCGFQWQQDIPSIQDELNKAIGKITHGKITTMGASRTDTGVHAMEQVVKITSEHPIESSALTALNSFLPKDIRCLDLKPSSGEFKPASDPISKEYRYFFTNKREVLSEDRRFISNNPYTLNIDAMKTCFNAIIGTHNFQNFCSAGSNVKSTIRDITFCELSEIDPHTIFSGSELFQIPKDLERCYQLRIVGNGFLKQMIRHLMSATWMVGSGKLTTDEFLHLLNGPKRDQKLWKVAPSQGLFLYKLNY